VNAAASQPLLDGEPDEMAQRVARLSGGQLECLRLVNAHLSSKEIAAQLKISPHTVDQRIRGALAVLGVERRAQAARIVAQYDELYQRLIHQSPDVELTAPTPQPMAATGYQIRHAGRARGVREPETNTEQGTGTPWPSLQLPIATRSNPRNEMSAGLRLLWIAGIAFMAAFSAGMYLAGLESLSRLIQG
jgi:DNA-binding CsgD family transcriptional regulator